MKFMSLHKNVDITFFFTARKKKIKQLQLITMESWREWKFYKPVCETLAHTHTHRHAHKCHICFNKILHFWGQHVSNHKYGVYMMNTVINDNKSKPKELYTSHSYMHTAHFYFYLFHFFLFFSSFFNYFFMSLNRTKRRSLDKIKILSYVHCMCV